MYGTWSLTGEGERSNTHGGKVAGWGMTIMEGVLLYHTLAWCPIYASLKTALISLQIHIFYRFSIQHITTGAASKIIFSKDEPNLISVLWCKTAISSIFHYRYSSFYLKALLGLMYWCVARATMDKAGYSINFFSDGPKNIKFQMS